jgi:dTDP-4-amino-4,6-dideoxygalactose transaminase
MDLIKKTIEDLAFLGGRPAFESVLHVGRPNIGDRERFSECVNDILDRRWLSNGGRYVQEFEKAIANHVGVKHCIVVNNATIALEIAIRALDLKGEVILPSFTFIATAHALQWLGVTPVFCDIDPQTYNMNPLEVESLISPRTTAILGVHVYGRPCDCDALEDIARSHNLRLFYDAAHAFGCSYKGKMIGNFGDLEVFSFHATKFLNSLEGGAIVTNNDDLAKRARRMTNFGFVNYDLVEDVGTNGKMNEVSAAMGLTNLETIDELIAVNYSNYKQYQKELNDLNGVRLVTFDEAEKNNYQYLVLEIDEASAGISRDNLTKILHAENVLARRYFYPGCHRMEPYLSLFPEASACLPVTEHTTERMLCLPTGTGISQEQIRGVSQIIRLVLMNSDQISSHMNKLAG